MSSEELYPVLFLYSQVTPFICYTCLLQTPVVRPQSIYFLWPCSSQTLQFAPPPVQPTIPLFWVSHKATDVIREDDDYSYITESN